VATLTDEQKTIYALGLLMQQSIRTFDLSPEELDIVKRALSDGAAGMPAIKLDDWGPRIDPLASARRVRRAAREQPLARPTSRRRLPRQGPSGRPRVSSIATSRSARAVSPAASDTVKVTIEAPSSMARVRQLVRPKRAGVIRVCVRCSPAGPRACSA
jgi:FKBP-type peptidyl-prolyl cis-trans isomerase FkpA